MDSSSSLLATSVQLWVAGLPDLRWVPSRWNLPWMYFSWSYMLRRRLSVNLGVGLCRMFHICRFMLWCLRVLSMSSAGYRRFATTRSRLG